MKLILLAVLLVGLLIVVGYGIFFSDFFNIKAVEVIGNESVTSEEIIKAAEVAAVRAKTIYKLFGSRNILFWAAKEMSEPMKNIPQVASIKVVRDISAKSVKIKVVERKKFAVWCEGECFWIDEEGVIFSEAPETEGVLVRTVRVNSERRLQVGERPLLEKEARMFTEAVKFLDGFGLIISSMEIEDLRFKETRVKVSKGPTIYFSLIVNPSFGKPVIESLKENGTWERVDYLDLRVDGRAYYKLR